MAARALATVGTALVVVGLLAIAFDVPARLPQVMQRTLLIGGIICLVAYLVLDKMRRRKTP